MDEIRRSTRPHFAGAAPGRGSDRSGRSSNDAIVLVQRRLERSQRRRRTAEFHVGSLINKFDPLNRTEVVSRAIQLGMIRPDEESADIE